MSTGLDSNSPTKPQMLVTIIVSTKYIKYMDCEYTKDDSAIMLLLLYFRHFTTGSLWSLM